MLPLTALPPPVGAPRALAAPTTIDFNDINPVTDPNLDGEYPVGVIEWGSGQWLASGPYGTFTDTSISYTTAVPTSGEFELIGDLRLVSFQASNGSDRSSVVSASCGDEVTVTQTVPGNSLVTFTTNWYAACSLVTLSSSNGWDTNFDNLVVDSSVATPTPTPTPTETPGSAPTATPTPSALCEIDVRINGGRSYWVQKPIAYCEPG